MTTSQSPWRNTKLSPSHSPITNGDTNGKTGEPSHSSQSSAPPPITFTFPAANDAWKAVGSPPRKGSVQGSVHAEYSLREDDEDDDADVRRFRARTASTPSTPNGGLHPNGVDIPNTNRFLHSGSPGYPTGTSPNEKWGSLTGFQWAGPSIWTEGNSGPNSGPGSRSSPPPGEENRNVNVSLSFGGVEDHRDMQIPPGMMPQIPLEPIQRQYRSLSFSMGQDGSLFGYGDDDDGSLTRSGYRSTLSTMEEGIEEDDYPQYGPPRFPRERSKSSAAAFGILTPDAVYGEEYEPQYERRGSTASGLWPRASSANPSHAALNHRRSVTATTGYSPLWDGQQGADPTSAYTNLSPADRERLERLRAQRRYSLAPAPTYHDYPYLEGGQDTRLLTRPFDEYSALNQRRHSVAAPQHSNLTPEQQTNRYLTDTLEKLHLEEVRDVQPSYLPQEPSYPSREFMETVDDYFDNDEHRTRSYNEMGKGIPLHQLPHQGPLYIVEFKAGRTDLFYVAENSGMQIKKGDLVIVEADRGKDLGKVTIDNLNLAQVQILAQQQVEIGESGHRINKELHPKRIYRPAQASEITMLMAKNQDEAKAMMVCQTKVRQKKLPMEVVDAEYQWDRRKLTFYFIAERRIDFRELVRDLFKIYKTRIWMCAVGPKK